MNDSIIFLKLVQVYLNVMAVSKYVRTFTRNNFDLLLLVGVSMVVRNLFLGGQGLEERKPMIYLKGILSTFPVSIT